MKVMRERTRPPLGAATRPARRVSLGIGDLVEVRNRFDDRWIHGFAIAVVGDAAYQLRRMSDGYVLPAWFAADVIRPDPAG